MQDPNTGNAAHYAELAIKALKSAGHEDLAAALTAKWKNFKEFRMLQPKRLVEQPFPVVERMVDELQLHADIDNDVLITIFHLKSQQIKSGFAAPQVIFEKQRCWRLSHEAESVLNKCSPELSKLKFSAEQKVNLFAVLCRPVNKPCDE